jgi:hypothetical protein
MQSIVKLHRQYYSTNYFQIGDFGMARDLMDETYYTPKTKGGKIPVKWTAPEVT